MLVGQLTNSAQDNRQPSAQTGWMIARLFGTNHWCAGYVDRLCQVDPDFFHHLSQQTAAYLHYLCLVRLAWRACGDLSNERLLVKQAGLLRTCRKKQLLSTLYDPLPVGLLNVLPKLGNMPLSRLDYQRLIRIVTDSKKRGYVAHLARVKPYHLQWIDELPIDLIHWRVLYSVKKANHYATLKYLAKVIRKLEDNHHNSDVLVLIKKLRSLHCLENWFRRYTRNLAFPSPPWKGNDWIVPILSARMLKRMSLKYHNCIYEYSGRVLLAQYYFYEVLRGPAIVSLIRDPIIGWYIEDINGIKNRKPGPALIEKIKLAFSNAGIQTEQFEELEQLWEDDTSFL